MKNKEIVLCMAFAAIVVLACQQENEIYVANTITMQPKLSDYGIFQGQVNQLMPSKEFVVYELASTLFTDYAQKQRLIKIPPGSTITPLGDELPDFPDGTMLVKTFYYDTDQRDLAKGHLLLETRVEIKDQAKWNVATYVWNDKQTDAILTTEGFEKDVSWIDLQGVQHQLTYQVPSAKECSSCHQSGSELRPIGPKIRSLNRDVTRNGTVQNQLHYLHQAGIMSSANPSNFASLPDWRNSQIGLESRVRAYLDMNCAHCHSDNGYASNTDLRFDYALPLDQTGIKKNKNRITRAIKTGRMPKIGTTVVDEEALDLIRAYVGGLD